MSSDWLPDRARWTYLDRSAVFNYSPKESISLGHMVNDAFMGIGWWDVGLGVKELHNSGDHGSETGVTKCGSNFITITRMHLMQCEIFRRHKIC